MKIGLRDDKLVLTFKYDSRVVERVKALPGRHYSPRHKQWIVPMDHLQAVIDTLIPLGFHADPAIFALREKEETKRVMLAAIRDRPDMYDGRLPLYDFQKIGAMFMRASDGTLLADVPGLGKTIQTIAALETLPGPFLVLCPASLKYGWMNEIKKWEPGASVLIVEGKPSEREYKWKYAGIGKVKYIIANYELLLRDLALIKPVAWSAIVCDEATRISNARAKTVKSLRQLTAAKRIALTGTPVSNTPIDLWSIVDWIRPGYIGTFPQFKDTYVVTDWWGNTTGYINLDDLSAKISPLMLRRTKEEVFKDFPAKTIENVVFELSSEEKLVYEGVLKRILIEIDEYLTKIDHRTLSIIPVKMLRLKQATDHVALLGDKALEMGSSKMNALEEILEPIIASGEKVIIFTQFVEMAKIMNNILSLSYGGIEMIYGDVKPEERQEIVKRFNTEQDRQILIMTEAGAYGLNLQGASYVVHYDAPWSVAKLMQREDRAHRIGQTKPVTVYNLIAKNTIDEYVAAVLHKKHKTSQDILKDIDRLEDAGLDEVDIKRILRVVE